MKIYAENGFLVNECERLELGRLLLKAGYIVLMSSEKVSNKKRHFIEFYHKVDFGAKKSAPGGDDTRDGAGKHSTDNIPQQEADCNAL